jgi:hypothetical protein
MKPFTPYIIAFIFLISFFANTNAQSVTVKASVNTAKILIGETIELKLEARVDDGQQAQWFPTDTIAHFEYVNKAKIDTVSGAGYKTYTQVLTITSFDSGRWEIGPFPLTVGNKDYLTDSILVSVAESNFDAKQDYHDIKDIVEVSNPNLRYITWSVGALGLLSLLTLIYFLRRKNALQQPVLEIPSNVKLTAIQEARQTLEALLQQGYHIGGIKNFHTQLNDILRRYLLRKTGVAAMGKTSNELMLQIKQFPLVNTEFTNLAQVLRMNDAVKFAKFLPGDEENNQAFNTIQSAIEQLDKIISS